jgi:hypothetical protein
MNHPSPAVFGHKNFIVALTNGLDELFSCSVTVDCYTPGAAKPGDMCEARTEMWRASEKAMMGYKRYCHENGIEPRPVLGMMITLSSPVV